MNIPNKLQMDFPTTIQEYTNIVRKLCREWNTFCYEKYRPKYGSDEEMALNHCFGCAHCLQIRYEIGCGDGCQPGDLCIAKRKILQPDKLQMDYPETLQEYANKIKEFCRGWNACIDKYGSRYSSEEEMVSHHCFGCEIGSQYRYEIGCGDGCQPGDFCIVKRKIQQ